MWDYTCLSASRSITTLKVELSYFTGCRISENIYEYELLQLRLMVMGFIME